MKRKMADLMLILFLVVYEGVQYTVCAIGETSKFFTDSRSFLDQLSLEILRIASGGVCQHTSIIDECNMLNAQLNFLFW